MVTSFVFFLIAPRGRPRARRGREWLLMGFFFSVCRALLTTSEHFWVSIVFFSAAGDLAQPGLWVVSQPLSQVPWGSIFGLKSRVGSLWDGPDPWLISLFISPALSQGAPHLLHVHPDCHHLYLQVLPNSGGCSPLHGFLSCVEPSLQMWVLWLFPLVADLVSLAPWWNSQEERNL